MPPPVENPANIDNKGVTPRRGSKNTPKTVILKQKTAVLDQKMGVFSQNQHFFFCLKLTVPATPRGQL